MCTRDEEMMEMPEQLTGGIEIREGRATWKEPLQVTCLSAYIGVTSYDDST